MPRHLLSDYGAKNLTWRILSGRIVSHHFAPFPFLILLCTLLLLLLLLLLLFLLLFLLLLLSVIFKGVTM